MLKFMFIPNKDSFLDTVMSCQGSVLLHLPDNTTCDLKTNPVARQMVKLLPPDQSNLKLSFSDARDYSRFIRYMLEVRGESAVAC